MVTNSQTNKIFHCANSQVGIFSVDFTIDEAIESYSVKNFLL